MCISCPGAVRTELQSGTDSPNSEKHNRKRSIQEMPGSKEEIMGRKILVIGILCINSE